MPVHAQFAAQDEAQCLATRLADFATVVNVTGSVVKMLRT